MTWVTRGRVIPSRRAARHPELYPVQLNSFHRRFQEGGGSPCILLAVPTMLAATAYDIYKNFGVFSFGDWENILAGFLTSFLFAVIAVKALLKFITSHTFIPFGIYRIAAGILFLLVL